MASAGAFHGSQPKRKPTKEVDRLPRDGHTGMGSSTEKQFIDVQRRMMAYVYEHDALQYDEVHPPPPHVHKRDPHVDRAFLDGKKAHQPRSSQSSAPVASHKQLAHHGLTTPQVEHRHRRSSPRPPAK